MKLRFLGGAGDIGSSAMIMVCNNQRFLFDYGMTPSRPPKYPLPAPPVDAVFLSHAHLDHSGMIPWLCSRYDLPIIATPLTFDIALLLINDSLKIVKEEGYPEPYAKRDVLRTKECLHKLEFGETGTLGELEFRTHSAGHIPGATMFELKLERTVLFTGDINTLTTNLVNGAKPVQCDTLILEATYAGREHPKRNETVKNFINKLEDVRRRNGVSIVPAFAVGRTQELMLILKDTGFEIWLDGMSKTVNRIYLNYPAYIRSTTKLYTAMERVKVVRSAYHRARALKGDVILTTSGVLDGGPVLNYAAKIRDDANSAILLTGFQVPGSNGRRLLDTGHLEIAGRLIKMNCELGFFDFSAHAGHSELIDFIDGCNPETIVLMHGENRAALAKELDNYKVLTPEIDEWLEI